MALTDAQMQAMQEAEDIDTGVDTRTKEEMLAEQMSDLKSVGRTIKEEGPRFVAETAPITGDAIAMYELPEDMKNAFALIKQGYSEGDIKDMGLGAGYAALTAAGVVPGLGIGARVVRKGLRASFDDAVEQTGDLFRTASGMDDTSGLITVTDESVKITKPPKSVQKGPTTFKFFGGDKGVSSDQKYNDYASSKKKANQESFDTDTDKEEFIFRDSKGTYVDPADNKFRYEIGTADLKLADGIQDQRLISFPIGGKPINKDVSLSFLKLENAKRKAAVDAGFEPRDYELNDPIKLPELLNDHKVFEEYPFLRNIVIRKAETGPDLVPLYEGAYKPASMFSNDVIFLNTNNTAENFKAIIAHEVQHAIDFFEGRQSGADLDILILATLKEKKLIDPDVNDIDEAIDIFNQLDDEISSEVYEEAAKKYTTVAGEVDARNVEFRLKNPNLQFDELPTKFTDEGAPKGKDIAVTKEYEKYESAAQDPASIRPMSAQTKQTFAEPLGIGVSEFNVKNLDNPNIIKNYTVDDYNEAMRASNAGSTAGSKAKNKKINASVEEGTDVSVRLNLSSRIDPDGPDAPFNRMQTIHPVNPNTKKPNYSKADSYMNVVTVENGVFDVNQTSRRNIAETGLKVPAASVQGKFNSTRNVLEEGGDDIIEIGMNPQRQHLFTDLSNGQAVRSFDVATIIRDRVYAKGVKYWKKAEAPTPLPAKGDKEIDNQVRYNMKKGGAIPMDRQMSMFDDGGLMDEGGTVDPISGNDVPPGSTQEEVRDDIPAQLSEGEFVFPADVVRYIGLSNLMKMRQEAKMGLKLMEEMGQMGNSEEATMPDDLPFDINDLDMEDEMMDNNPQQFAEGGIVYAQQGASVPSAFNMQMNQQPYQGYSPFPMEPGRAVEPVKAASSQYQAPQQSYTPTNIYKQEDVPKFRDFVGENIPNVDFEMVEYRNEAGNSIMIKISKATGNPVQGEVIPEGYTKYDPSKVKTEDVGVVTPETTRVMDSGKMSREEIEKQRKEDAEKAIRVKDRIAAAKELGYTEFTSPFSGLGGVLASLIIPGGSMIAGAKGIGAKGQKGMLTGMGYVLDGEGGMFDPTTGHKVPTGLMSALRDDFTYRGLSDFAENQLRTDAALKTEFGIEIYNKMVDNAIEKNFAKYEKEDRDEETSNYIKEVKEEIKKEATKGNVNTKGKIISPFEAQRGLGKYSDPFSENRRQDFAMTPTSGYDPSKDARVKREQAAAEEAAAQQRREESFSYNTNPASDDKDGGTQSGATGGGTAPGGVGGSYGGMGGSNPGGSGGYRAKGGLMEAPKPKTKKKMKRGGLASKK